MKKTLVFFVMNLVAAQTVVAQSVVNAYAKVTAVSGQSVLTLSNVNQTNHTFSTGEEVIIMQMQDNVIGTNTTNVSTFGDLSAIGNAGGYEIRTISARTPATGAPTSVTLTPNLVLNYNTGSNSAVQLITFRNLGANYTTTNNLTALAWDGDVGGVLAIQGTSTITLQHRLTVDGQGFRGGAASGNADQACANTFYTGNDVAKGWKGEGIYKSTNTTFNNGRGKIITGGGGGSQNNAGGGGGGNYSTGGQGGRGYNCTAANSGYGLGGIALSTYINSSRVYMGGGGGGGQGNNSVATPGGNGGGIILLRAPVLRTSTTCTSSILISANGNSVANTSGGGNDGAGGGGAAGSIILEVTTYTINGTCPLVVRASGGNGGNVTNGTNHGGGGGGGQGAIIYSGPQPTLNTTSQTVPGLPGADENGGTITAGSGGGTSGAGIVSSGGPLPVELMYFDTYVQSDGIELRWRTAMEINSRHFEIERAGEDYEFKVLSTIPGAGNTGSARLYSYLDRHPISGINYYRLKQVDFDGTHSYSIVRSIEYMPDFEIGVFPNPLGKGQDCYITLGKDNLEPVRVLIYDTQGNLVYQTLISKSAQEKSGRILLPGLDLNKGLYILCAYAHAHREQIRIVVE